MLFVLSGSLFRLKVKFSTDLLYSQILIQSKSNRCISMADVHDEETRSYNMSQIRSKNTKPELIVRKLLHANGFRFRLHVKELPGKPDIVLPKYKTVINVHGCFWHGHHECKYFKLPKTNSLWWKNKINHTKERDLENSKALKSQGWNVITVFECQLKKENINTLLEQIFTKLNKNNG